MGFKDFFKWLDNHARESNDYSYRVAVENERKRKAEKERQEERWSALEDIPSYPSSESCCANCCNLEKRDSFFSESVYRCKLHDFVIVESTQPGASHFIHTKRCDDFLPR